MALRAAPEYPKTAACVAVLAGMLASGVARAGEMDVRLSLRGVGEAWRDPVVTGVFRGGGLGGGAAASVGILPWLQAELEATYKRLSGFEPLDDGKLSPSTVPTTLELIPVSIQVQLRQPLGEVAEVFGGLGPSWTLFTLTHSDWNDRLSTTGTKYATELRLGLRVDTGLVQPSRFPDHPAELQAVELEFYAGYRWQLHPEGTGFDLSALRAAVGLGLRF